MKPVILIPSAALCFATGWWLDATWNRQKTAGQPPHSSSSATQAHTPASPDTAPAPVPRSREPARADTAEELLLLCDEWDLASAAKLQEALQHKSKEELSTLIRQLAKMLPRSGEASWELSKAAHAVLEYLLPLDPVEGMDFAFLFQNEPSEEPYPALMAAIQKVFAKSPQQAAEIYSRRGGIHHIMPRYEWITGMDGMEPRQALEKLMEFDRLARCDIRGLTASGEFGEQWVKQDAPAAMTWALNLNPGPVRELLTGTIFGAWESSDPAALRGFLNDLTASSPQAEYARRNFLRRLDLIEKERAAEARKTP